MYSWLPLTGNFDINKDDNIITFLGKEETFENNIISSVGRIACDQFFSSGLIKCDIQFDNIESNGSTACEVMINFDPANTMMLTAGIGGNAAMFSLRHWNNSKWNPFELVGDYNNLKSNENYHVEIYVDGSLVGLNVNGVTVIVKNIPFRISNSQIGLFCLSKNNITIKNIEIQPNHQKAFIVMQFSSPYNELYEEVIKPVCKDLEIDCIRADEHVGPGIIISDITKQITESNLVIAEISSLNPNVFYEVGYSHAINKPTILISDDPKSLPFDVSPFRVLTYVDSIAGKKRIEEGLRSHIKAALNVS